ncbi:MAG TPA: hypothetical protein PLC59_07650 [Bacteroidales bacterium]|jgi:hypothetical protein|nr:hypothetical protein [Bacteroidales bacterium]
MIKIKTLICEDKVPAISLQQAVDNDFFGPVYHGTYEDNLSKIEDEGFKIFIGIQRSGDISHGYEDYDYHSGIPAPIHHLGFGVYFTTVKSIAVRFSGGSKKVLKKAYFLNVPRLEIINFGVSHTMMKWWIKNGYDFNPDYKYSDAFARYSLQYSVNRGKINQERLRATINMTNVLKSKFDAVWFKGKGIRRLLDGDQICVYEPEGKIFLIDPSLSKGFEIGSVVRAKKDIQHINRYGEAYGKLVPAGTKGIIKNRREMTPLQMKSFEEFPWYRGASINKYAVYVKWKNIGNLEVADGDIEPLKI